MTQERWFIYIDMQGFSALYGQEDQVLWSLGELMRAIYRTGTLACPSIEDRLFAHQTGDGFVVLSDFHESSPLRAIAIAIILLRRVASTGRFARASISEGELADIVGCYPREVTEQRNDDGVVGLGHGLMTIFPVMGTGLIRAVGIEKKGPSGPLLLLDPKFIQRIPPEMPFKRTGRSDSAPLSIDWIHANHPFVTELWNRTGFPNISAGEIEKKLVEYREQFKLDKWTDSLARFLNL